MATEKQIVDFIKTLGTLAVAECNKRIANGQPFILPSVCIAQAAHETGWGGSGLMDKANAFFGIKAGGSWTGKVFVADTWEVAPNGVAYNTTANFRAYDSLEDSVADYYGLTTGASRYSKALCYGADPSKWLTPKEVVTALWQGGYATDTLYVEKVMNFINPRKLYEWDTKITGEGFIAEVEVNKNTLTQGDWRLTDEQDGIDLDTSIVKGVSTANTTIIKESGTFIINGLGSDYELYIARVTINDDPMPNHAIITGPKLEGESITLAKGEVVGFTIRRIDGSDLSPTDLPSDLDLRLVNELTPDNSESYSSELAFFVKIT